ncbi:hypothetical protein EYF80_033420 [Liparis tanakae]|uniref:Uncharacterized protein n=1 Tax=Liparis tanakae TaxID=230148 RepID=A0A4Z2GUV8_9TELE|nr:hypothetical protein EYF80_033420 [Liparis tanakae]
MTASNQMRLFALAGQPECPLESRRRPPRGAEGASIRLTPYTCLAPALAANMQRIPVPLPTSRTTLFLNACLLWYMAFR